jgi:hypothetical protein
MKRGPNHGYSQTQTYHSWEKMWQRCTNRKRRDWKWYGARGIKVCRRWRDFRLFLKDMGECPEGMTLDRLDPEHGYTRRNCRWATWEQQRETQRKPYSLEQAESLIEMLMVRPSYSGAKC